MNAHSAPEALAPPFACLFPMPYLYLGDSNETANRFSTTCLRRQNDAGSIAPDDNMSASINRVFSATILQVRL